MAQQVPLSVRITLESLAEQEQIQGVVDVMFSLGSEERDLLEESYPEADLDNVLVVNMVPLGHEEPPARFWLIIAALGIIPLLIGLGAIAFGVLRARRGRGA